ncbi:uncharacterized protein PV07_06784 [Cladophialophora immunda]|uniref:Nuclear distribution protein RO10 n=1 Tax=Cladophialophora immunda TaxID=569365 RepID=A0A0D2APL2_9EURO|nr:uncharacterized protein PV07_06784 [Cladophialophora immunda]KIW27002.1 hypothetical protein PV07_06784 [Cladophialophora immunda]OQV04001.1 hypothetical protein CLAIMM_08956 [Cladophialophora immunda]
MLLQFQQCCCLPARQIARSYPFGNSFQMATEVQDPETAARGTLALLGTRLHRLEFLLSGASNDDGVPPPTTTPTSGSETLWARLDALEAAMAKLKKLTGTPGSVVRDIERLSSLYPDLFAVTATATPKSEDISTLASVVLSHATLYPETASRLSSLQTLQIPPADQSSKLVSLAPRLEKLRQEEDQIQEEVRELRERSARCLEWWVKIGVVGMGDMWEDWERRTAEVERNIIRWERRAKEQQGYL